MDNGLTAPPKHQLRRDWLDYPSEEEVVKANAPGIECSGMNVNPCLLSSDGHVALVAALGLELPGENAIRA
jgi:hypothetical protein